MDRAVFLDRDGTINVDKGYVYKIEDFEFIPGVLDGLRILEKQGFHLFVVTNQSGIARGYYTEEDFARLTQYMLAVMEDSGVHVTDVLYCPHLPEAKIGKYRVNCRCRKPGTKLFHDAAEKWDIDLDRSYVIGDKLSDCALCAECGCTGFLISDQAGTAVLTGDIRCVDRFASAVDEILRMGPA
ncbi:HAD family hydrolase [uncultured Oscillibacter sp.]|uniref:D-glycero-alpha-D-manno-heptose-1,7-bisphosphate 7-phosphatase n=1 Tax=uncultured Oscillibacter sp. TaxID=876091 RepID=UPI0025FC29C4|nr:HAD family hydrolase [uncultured Oscillibacter sp.]